MSIRVMDWVWRTSPTTSGDRLVLLAIADSAEDDGANAWPSLATICAKTRMSERAVRYALRRLEEGAHIITEKAAGPRGCNRYRVVMATPETGADPAGGQELPGADSVAGGGKMRHEGGQMVAPEPSLTRPNPSTSRIDETRDDVEAVCDLMVRAVVDVGGRRPTVTAEWRREARLLLDRDKRPLPEILAVIRWVHDDPFERANVLSVPKLRRRYDSLALKARRDHDERVNPKGRDPAQRSRTEPVPIDKLLRRAQ